MINVAPVLLSLFPCPETFIPSTWW